MTRLDYKHGCNYEFLVPEAESGYFVELQGSGFTANQTSHQIDREELISRRGLDVLPTLNSS